MIEKIKYGGILVGALLMLTTSGALANTWWDGAVNTNLSSGIVELQTDMNVPSLPSANADPNTLFWLGGISIGTTSGGTHTDFLTQPEILPVQADNKWKVAFEALNAQTNQDTDYTLTNLEISPSGSLHFVDDVFASGPDTGDNYQEFDDNNNGNNQGSVLFTGAHYGPSFHKAYGTLEATDFTSSDWHPMDGTVSFTTFHSCTALCAKGAGSSVTLSSYENYTGSTLPPSCITATGGTGTASIKDTC